MKRTLFLCLQLLLAACNGHSSDLTAQDGAVDSLYSTQARDFAVVVNSADPHSLEVARYYVAQRKIPPENRITIQFDPSLTQLSAAHFAAIKAAVDRQVPEHVQFLVLTWSRTYRVECTSITSAFTFGYSDALGRCDRSCDRTRFNPYVEDGIFRPHTQLGIRPTMMLAAGDFADAVSLIDRGLRADFSRPYDKHRAFLLRTSDAARSVRKKFYPDIEREFGQVIEMETRNSDAIRNEENVMFYFTGLARVPDIDTNTYLPGAVADHLTSYGGQLFGERQMSALAWLQAGATASYGTVVEPCSHTEKFPDPARLMRHYFAGATVIEAYWKSVLMPGQGLFIGEPMARPYRAPPAKAK